MSVEVRVGRWRCRDGKERHVTKRNPESLEYIWEGVDPVGRWRITWTREGKYLPDGSATPRDLIEYLGPLPGSEPKPEPEPEPKSEDDLHIWNGEQMPVCLNGDRLEFTRMCSLNILHAGTLLTRHEPAGASWDGATIPRWLWSIAGHPLPPEYRWASYWHDRFCEGARCIEDRTIADAVFLRLLREAGIARWRRLAMWAVVRFYGLVIWRMKNVRRS